MYPKHLVLPPYTTNTGYRQCLRQIFQMNKDNYPESIKQLEEELGDDFDKETRDEIEYDEDSAGLMMQFIRNQTKHLPIFQRLYELAAARFLSRDHEIGVAILYAYEYLPSFHKCVCIFLNNPDELTENTAAYKDLVGLLN
jgi:hypothetical protein